MGSEYQISRDFGVEILHSQMGPENLLSYQNSLESRNGKWVGSENQISIDFCLEIALSEMGTENIL